MLVQEIHSRYISVSKTCKEKKLWQVERTLGAILLDVGSVWLPQAMRRNRCYKTCIDAGKSKFTLSISLISNRLAKKEKENKNKSIKKIRSYVIVIYNIKFNGI